MGDAAIRDTDNDAAVSRLSAVNAQYLKDPFAGYFVKRAQQRPPLINIGTFLRTWAIDQLVLRFLDSGLESQDSPQRKKQIVSLGAGTDTRFFRIQSSGAPRATTIAKYVEVDFPEATTRKAMAIKKQPSLSSLLGAGVRLEQGGTSLVSPTYCLIPGDLRDFDATIAPRLLELLDPTLPTLLLAECVFVYIDPTHSNSIFSWFTSSFKEAGSATILYDPVGLDDSFGKVMIANLRARGLTLHGLEPNTSQETQERRLRECGFSSTFSKTIRQIRREVLPVAEASRISKLEFLDEIEELDLLLSHYSIAWAYNPPSEGNADVFHNMRLPDK